MKFAQKVSLVIGLFAIFIGLSTGSARAAGLCQISINPDPLLANTAYSLSIGLPQLPSGQTLSSSPCDGGAGNDPRGSSRCFQIRYCVPGSALGGCTSNVNYMLDTQKYDGGGSTITATGTMLNDATKKIRVWVEESDGNGGRIPRICAEQDLDYVSASTSCGDGMFKVTNDQGSDQFTYQDSLKVAIDGSKASGFGNGSYNVFVEQADGNNGLPLLTTLGSVSGGSLTSANASLGKLPIQTYHFVITDGAIGKFHYCETGDFIVSDTPGKVVGKNNAGATTASFHLCDQASDAKGGGPQYKACIQCVAGDDTHPTGIWTAVGCIPTAPSGLIGALIKVGLGLSGGVVLLSILAGAFMLATSAGDPKRVQEAQQMISASVIGLLLVIFSVIIVQFLGVSILHIPGFGG